MLRYQHVLARPLRENITRRCPHTHNHTRARPREGVDLDNTTKRYGATGIDPTTQRANVRHDRTPGITAHCVGNRLPKGLVPTNSIWI